MQAIFGEPGAKVMAAAILISTFGCVNGLVMAGARIYFAMARDGLFFKSVARANRFHVPGWALAAQGLWATVLLVLGPGNVSIRKPVQRSARIRHSRRCDVLHADGGGRHRATIPAPLAPRPYRTIAYPLPPLLYIGIAVLLVIDFIYLNPGTSGIGFLIVLAGIPVYFIWSWLGAGMGGRNTSGVD